MSAQAAIEFVGKTIPMNPALAAEVAKAVEGKDANAAAAAVVAIGKKQGLDFTAEEAMGARAAVMEHLRKEKVIGDELSEQDLDRVAGGASGPTALWSDIKNPQVWQGMGSAFSVLGTAQGWQNFGSGMASLGSKSTWNTVGNSVKSVFSGW
ncbi:MAG: hypothetical protein FJX62_11420 [Alphaproteobacteria bacterium]|nr:hypothetical protein [Alphaproteobacteria bacterium]